MIMMILALVCTSVSVNADNADPFVASTLVAVVSTNSGKLQGFIQNGIYTYRGAPYAKAERFMMPEKFGTWDGIRPALTYGETCLIPPMSGVANDELFNPHRYLPQSEHCQFLNIWTPGIRDNKKRSVMVWLHGGGFTNGSSIEQVAYSDPNLRRREKIPRL